MSLVPGGAKVGATEGYQASGNTSRSESMETPRLV
jgi:hypothetical protein